MREGSRCYGNHLILICYRKSNQRLPNSRLRWTYPKQAAPTLRGQGFLRKQSANNQGFLHLAAFQYNCVEGKENDHSIQNGAAGKIPVDSYRSFPRYSWLCSESWFQLYQQPSCSCTIHCQAGKECVIPEAELSSQSLSFANT